MSVILPSLSIRILVYKENTNLFYHILYIFNLVHLFNYNNITYKFQDPKHNIKPTYLVKYLIAHQVTNCIIFQKSFIVYSTLVLHNSIPKTNKHIYVLLWSSQKLKNLPNVLVSTIIRTCTLNKQGQNTPSTSKQPLRKP